MTLNIGVIGTGNIGTYHINRFATELSDVRVASVYDLDTDRAGEIARSVGASVHDEATDLIQDPAVEAVVITSPGQTHGELVLACINVNKPVMCEKPLATTTQECVKILEAETALGRCLVQVGFMRRYDHGYGQMKEALDTGRIGEPLLAHCIHRNPTVPPTFTSEMAMNDSIIHELDATRWLFADEIVAARVVAPRRSPHAEPHLQDPQVVLLETASGALVTAEIFVNCQYGYDVQCEIVGSEGTVVLETPRYVSVTKNGGRAAPIPQGWRERFDGAFRAELIAWTAAAAAGTADGPSSWDGYAATAVADACVEAQQSGERVPVSLVDCPDLYR